MTFHPLHLETVLYVSPIGEPVRSALVLKADVTYGHHLIAIGRRRFHADARDVRAFPGWRREREMRAMEEAEALADAAEL